MTVEESLEIADRNKETVREFFQRLEQEDIPSFLDLFAENGRQVNPYASGIFPDGAAGREELRAYWEPVPKRFDSMRFPIDEIHAMEDPSIVFARYRGEITLKDGGGLYANDYYSTFRFDEFGKITEYVEIFNPILAAHAFGLVDQITDGQSVSEPDATLIANTLACYFAAVDRHDWDYLEGLMTDPFHLDYSSFSAGEPADLEPATVLAGWKQVLPGFTHTHHQIGNVDIEVDGNSAKVKCYVTATHQIEEKIWTVVGAYEASLRQEGGGWKMAGMRFVFKYQTGATDLPQEAQRRLQD